MEYQIIEGEDEHLEDVVGLWQKSMEFHRALDPLYFSVASTKGEYFSSKVKNYMYLEGAILLVLLVDSKVVGFVLADIETNASIYESTRYCNIEDIMVDESLRGKGFGQMLLGRAIEWGKEHNAEKAKLFVHSENPKAIDLYERFGFQNKLLRMEEELGKLQFVEPQKAPIKEEKKGTLVSSHQLERLLPQASEWAEEQERFILENGVRLDREYKELATSIGVQQIDMVRLLKVDRIPLPEHPELREIAEALGLINKDTVAITFRHGIFIRSDYWYDKRVVFHELCHTMQYERLGGIKPFLEQYLSECLSDGYSNCKLEKEAILKTRLFTYSF